MQNREDYLFLNSSISDTCTRVEFKVVSNRNTVQVEILLQCRIKKKKNHFIGANAKGFRHKQNALML